MTEQFNQWAEDVWRRTETRAGPADAFIWLRAFVRYLYNRAGTNQDAESVLDALKDIVRDFGLDAEDKP